MRFLDIGESMLSPRNEHHFLGAAIGGILGAAISGVVGALHQSRVS